MKSYRDITGDGGSDVVGQVLELERQITEALADVRHVVAVASGKGGVGKSTVTAMIALGLARLGRRVAVLDADLNGPSQTKLMGLEGVPWMPGDDGLELPRRPDGVRVLSMGSVWGTDHPVSFETATRGGEHHWRSTREFSLLAQLLAGTVWGALDALVIDLPPGAERTVHHADFFGPKASFVVVTVPSKIARDVVGRSVSALAERSNEVLGWVENMAGYRCGNCDEIGPLFAGGVSDLGLPMLARIPFDPRVASLCDRGLPTGDELNDVLDLDLARAVWNALEAEEDAT